MKDKCGIIGAYSHKRRNVSTYIYYGLYALQHRGQESAGISTYNGKDVHIYRDMGLISDVFNNGNMEDLEGHVGIGHVRYSTTGESKIENSQPFFSEFDHGKIAISHNGDIINSMELRRKLEERGCVFRSTTDSEVICHLLTAEYQKTKDVIRAIEEVSKKLIGSYSLVMLVNGDLIVVRDPLGIKPLVLGKMDDMTVVASETVALDVIGAKYIRDIKPGEIMIINDKISRSVMKKNENTKRAHCMFEYVYFARPDSILEGKSIYDVRLKIGKTLAKEHPADADIVIPVPDSAITAALGYSRESGIPYGEGLIKNRYVGRTFIMPTQKERETSVRLKMNPIRTELKDRRIVLVDDSIVRGTTSKAIVDILKDAGVREVHLRIGCPPIISPCYYGIAMATKKELIASDKKVEEIKNILGVTSLGYLSIDSLVRCIGIKREGLCLGCLTGEYPTPLPRNIEQYEADRC